MLYGVIINNTATDVLSVVTFGERYQAYKF